MTNTCLDQAAWMSESWVLIPEGVHQRNTAANCEAGQKFAQWEEEEDLI